MIKEKGQLFCSGGFSKQGDVSTPVSHFADGGYSGEFEAFIRKAFPWMLHIVRKPLGVKTFQVLPKRWIVERTFSWLSVHRRLSVDYERKVKSSEAMIHIAMIRLMLKKF